QLQHVRSGKNAPARDARVRIEHSLGVWHLRGSRAYRPSITGGPERGFRSASHGRGASDVQVASMRSGVGNALSIKGLERGIGSGVTARRAPRTRRSRSPEVVRETTRLDVPLAAHIEMQFDSGTAGTLEST